MRRASKIYVFMLHQSWINLVCSGVFALVLSASLPCQAAFTAKSEKKSPPDEVSEAIAATLGETCYQVLEDGEPLFDFWLNKTIALKDAPASIEAGLDAPKVASLIGVVRVHDQRRDYRDDELLKGVFTMRFSKIPADGNHLGASAYPYFAVLIPVAKDQEIDGIDTYKAMTRASSRDTASQHPMIMSLRPVKEKPAEIPAITEPVPEHHCIVVSTEGKTADADEASEIIFEIVVEGVGEI